MGLKATMDGTRVRGGGLLEGLSFDGDMGARGRGRGLCVEVLPLKGGLNLWGLGEPPNVRDYRAQSAGRTNGLGERIPFQKSLRRPLQASELAGRFPDP